LYLPPDLAINLPFTSILIEALLCQTYYDYT